MRDSEPDKDGVPFIMLGAAIKGAGEIPVYSCPVAAAAEPWVHQVFAVSRNEEIPAMMAQVFPERPSAAFVEAVEYVRAESSKLRAEQRRRPSVDKP